MNNVNNVFVGGRLAYLRKLKGRTQKDIAEHFGISKQAVSKWENGLSMPDILLMPSIAKYFDVDIDYFFDKNVADDKSKHFINKEKVAISIKDFSKKYDDSKKYTIENLNLDIYDNVSTAIMGPSGCGKSTLLNCISGLEKSTSGSIYILGTDITKLKESKLTKFRRNNITYIFQQYNLIEVLNVIDNIKLPYKTSGAKINNKKLKHLINTLGLKGKEKVLPNKLSGGQQQRVAIARALLGENNIILADEPTGALDLKTSNEVLKLLLLGAKEFESPILIITHDINVASKCDIVHFMLDGKIIKTLERPSTDEVANIMMRLSSDE
ncbi:ATP-binding cassette domain-containing protein [Clostridiaceae bacterium M8S5]|nr:ATP-binding cassette domain-containing protein [Clostridiaceae bacterium M8S5]